MKPVLLALSVLVLLLSAAAAGGAWLFYRYGRALPDYKQLADYRPPMVTRVHAGDGRLLAEFSTQKRVFVPIEAIPRLVVEAFVSAEDKTFFDHPGFDLPGILGAAVRNLGRMARDERPVGASTITQQVAKNFLLTTEVSFERKAKEVILAFRIERAFSKQTILELYLNEIYLGFGSYGVAAAAINYFNKSLDELSLPEAAFLAGLPKAPNNYDPHRRPETARARRDYVVERMLDDGYLDEAEAAAAMAEPVRVRPPDPIRIARAGYFVEEVRRELLERRGADELYGGGLSVRTTVAPRLQAIADDVLRAGLLAYDRRHGWRGPLRRLDLERPWRPELAKISTQVAAAGAPEAWRRAVVLAVDPRGADIGLADGSLGRLPLAELSWARPSRGGARLGPEVERPGDVLAAGDVVLVEAAPAREPGESPPGARYALRQLPEIDGALAALDPHTGRVLALSGGFSYRRSEFNRATQARRQPGSAFKPFVYLAALDRGVTPSTLVLDAPLVIDQGPGLGKWRPSNYSRKFFGLSPLRLGIEKSRNLMTVRLAQHVGIETVADYAERFGIVDRLPHVLSMALGAGETTLLRLTAAYAMLVNGGRRIVPALIDRIQDRQGRTVYRHDARACDECAGVAWEGQEPPILPDARARVADPRSAYQVVSMLQGVVERGTGRAVRTVGKPLAGKTGTTNDSRDAWFVGFSPDLAVGVFVGFDEPRTLGRYETGASVAAPIFRDFMARALADAPAIPFRVPRGIRLVRVDSRTGRVARSGGRHVILEAFKPVAEPVGRGGVLGGVPPARAGVRPGTGMRDLY